MKRYRVGIIGCGWISHFYAKVLPGLAQRAHVVWVADPVRERAEVLGKKLGARALTDYGPGLAEVDAAFILVPHHLHLPITLDCLQAGCHVLLEKPIAISLEQAADRKGRTLMVAYPHRYRGSMQLFKRTLLSERYGRLFMLDGLMDESLGDYALGWIAKKETLGGGVFFSASPHMLDVMLWIAGDVRAAWMVGTRGGIGIEGEDTAASVIKFTNGVIGVTRHTWASPRSRIWYTMNAVCEKAHVTLTTAPLGDLVTEGAACRWQTRIVALGEKEDVLLESGEGLDVGPEVEHFMDCLDTGSTPETDGKAARKIIELVTGAYQEAEARGDNP